MAPLEGIVDERPFVDCWPLWDEPLSKVTAGLDIAAAREKLARRFNRRPVRLPKPVEVERAWEEHNESIRHPIGPRRQASTRGVALA
jgi:hypothetical protein